MTQSGSRNPTHGFFAGDPAQAIVDHGAYHRTAQTVEEPKNRSKRCSGCNDQQGDRREDEGGHGENASDPKGRKGRICQRGYPVAYRVVVDESLQRSPAPDNGKGRQTQQDHSQPHETGNSAPSRAGRYKLFHQLIGTQRPLGINYRGRRDHVVEGWRYRTVEDSQRALAPTQVLYGFNQRPFRRMFLGYLLGRNSQMLGE